MAKKRLQQPFKGFDSIDERMKRVPNDLNDDQIRLDYIKNHIKWFLTHHPDEINDFIEDVKDKYMDKLIASNQLWLIEQMKIGPSKN